MEKDMKQLFSNIGQYVAKDFDPSEKGNKQGDPDNYPSFLPGGTV